jgi:cell division septation protein DedD
MHQGFGGTVFEPVQESRDRELTIGPAMLLGIGCGWFLLCGLCFVFGYAVGHRYAETATALPNPGMPAITSPANPISKPSAIQGSGVQAQQPAITSDSSASSADDTAPDSTPVAVPVAAPTAAPVRPGPTAATPVQSPVRTALTGQPIPTQPVPVSGSSVQSALGQSAAIMVQIAAVAHAEDADVLVGALRKRGYAVTARRDPSDGLLHVQIGPFATRNDAIATRQKLLNDGYNAIIQP